MGASSELFLHLREQEQGITAGVSFEHLLDAKKSNISNAVAAITAEVQAGNYDSLRGLILALKGKTLFTDLEKALRPLAEDANVFKLEKGYQAHDCKVDQAETGVSYDYSVCNDPEWEYLNDRSVFFETELKERQKFLQSLTKPTTIVNDDTGEVSTINPPVRKAKLGLKITIK
jgi:hypothetical protein